MSRSMSRLSKRGCPRSDDRGIHGQRRRRGSRAATRQNKTKEQTVGRGFFAGTMWGALVGLLAVALATQLTVRRELSFPEPQAAALDVPGGSEFDQARPETEPVVPTVEAPPAQAEPVEVAEPEPEDTAAPRAD